VRNWLLSLPGDVRKEIGGDETRRSVAHHFGPLPSPLPASLGEGTGPEGFDDPKVAAASVWETSGGNRRGCGSQGLIRKKVDVTMKGDDVATKEAAPRLVKGTGLTIDEFQQLL
jgi:hypothetical protein